MTENKIKILVVDDSPTVCHLLKKMLGTQPDFCVLGAAANGALALQFLKDHQVDLILLDVEMPVMDGLTLLPLVKKNYPLTKVIMVSSLTTRGAEVTVKALVMGAVDYVTKPGPDETSSNMNDALLTKIRTVFSKYKKNDFPSPVVVPQKMSATAKALVIGSSTGGPNALVTFLQALPSSFLLPIFIVQHMPKNFVSALAERIAKETGRNCRLASQGEKIEGSTI